MPLEPVTVIASIILSHVNKLTFDVVKYSSCPNSAQELDALVSKVEDIVSRQKQFEVLASGPSHNYVQTSRLNNASSFVPSSGYSNRYSRPAEITCRYCKKPGHILNQCMKLKEKNRASGRSGPHTLNALPHPEILNPPTDFEGENVHAAGQLDPSAMEFFAASKN